MLALFYKSVKKKKMIWTCMARNPKKTTHENTMLYIHKCLLEIYAHIFDISQQIRVPKLSQPDPSFGTVLKGLYE